MKHRLGFRGRAISIGALLLVNSATSQGNDTDLTTLKTGTRLVVIDVVVTDKAGHAVQGLKESDFKLLENSTPQTLSRFEAFSVSDDRKAASLPKLPAGTFTNYSPFQQSGPINILLLDALNTPLKVQAFVRAEMLKYLESPRPGARTAIFGLNQNLRLLQGPTSDPEVLRAALTEHKGQVSPLLNDGVNGLQNGLDGISDTNLNDGPDQAEIVANAQQFASDQQSFQTTLRTQYTLDALNALGRYLAGLPGRKNLIWFSGAFPLNLLPDGSLTDPFGSTSVTSDEFRQTVTLLSRSQVSVYPVDARGLTSLPMFSAASSGAKYAANPGSLQEDSKQFLTVTANEHATMSEMAENTGGKAFVNTNGLKEAVDQAIDNGSNYYTLAYSPLNRDSKGDFRHVKIELADKTLQLAYRRGYYADDPDAPARKRLTPSTAATAALPTQSYDPMRLAMLWGGPVPTEIVLAAKVRPLSAQTEQTLVVGTQSAPGVSGPYKRYSVFFVADPKYIRSTLTASGKHHIEIEFATYAYSDQGKVLATTGNRLISDLSDDRYKALLAGGVQYQQQISVPVAARTAFLRMGMQDMTTGKTGAIEIPLSRVSGLPPSQDAPATTPAVKQ